MKKKYLVYALAPMTLGLGLLSMQMASAHGLFGGFNNLTPEQIATRQQDMFQQEANILGLSVDEVKTAWAEGKTMQELATAKGITSEQLQTKMQAARQAEMKTHLQALVDQGVITQAQADSRLKFMQERIPNGQGKMGRGMHKGGMDF